MMTPTSLLRTVIILVGLGSVLALTGCKLPSFVTPVPPPPVTPAPPSKTESAAPAPAVDQKRQAVRTVTDYVTALNGHDYTAAYDLLSQDSKKLHTATSFARQGKQGMPQYDLHSCQATLDGDAAAVVVQELEDPSLHTFHLLREGQAWKIVYRGGRPGVPDAGDLPRGGEREIPTNESDSQ